MGRTLIAGGGKIPWQVKEEIELEDTHRELVEIEKQIQVATQKHNSYLQQLGLSLLPGGD